MKHLSRQDLGLAKKTIEENNRSYRVRERVKIRRGRGLLDETPCLVFDT